ncbi:MAG: hypothetical protein ABFR97_00630 [Thermodesulfobacteriota bacterium]
MKFKETAREGDVVVIAMENPESIIYGLVTGFERDTSRKDEWYHVTLQLLLMPPQQVTWTLRVPQFSGQEIFTMGGDKRFIAPLDFAGEAGPLEPEPAPEKKGLRLVK